MAIIQRNSDGFDTLLNVLLQKEQLQLQTEQQKLAQGQLKIQEEQAQREGALRKAQEEGAMRALEFIGQNIGQDPSSAPEALDALSQQRQLSLQEEEVRGTLAHQAGLRSLDRRRLVLDRARVEAEAEGNDIALARIAAEDRRFDTEMEQRSNLVGLQMYSDMVTAAAAAGFSPSQFFESPLGTSDVSPRSLGQTIRGELELTPEESQQRHLTRMLSGFQIPEGVRNNVNEALFVEGVDPQAFAEELFAADDKDIDPEAKQQLFMALQSTYGNLRIPEPAQREPGKFMMLWNYISSQRGGPSTTRNSPFGTNVSGFAPPP